ncbi:hypothetical protein [Dyella flagellata]|uniref:Uncharacterized protein n=1 Tax=Dyella flagellata TaxID=1867833 RepID=A0ABQ5X879_9GAMM|nr:hypothetical protein [Dyella flagellata]GLQ86884.1 hypothetical protein GCM10007898_04500 [Dyella flagellata]
MQWGEALKAAPFVRLSRLSVGGVAGCIIGMATHIHLDGSARDDALLWNLLALLLICLVFACTFLPISWDGANRIQRGQPLMPSQQMYKRMILYFVASSLVASLIFYYVF